LSITPLCAKEYSLDELYKIAIERSEKVRISVEDVYIAMRNKDKAFSSFLPTLSAFGGYTRYSDKKRDRSSSILIQPDDVGYGGLRLDQSLSLGGREFTAYTMSKEGIVKSTHDLTAVKEDYIFLVSSAYYDLLRAKKAVEISKATVERLTKHRDAAASRLKVGEVIKTDLLRAEAELSGAKSDLIRAENNLKLTKANLARIAGLNEDYDIKEEPNMDQNATDGVEDYKNLAFSERAEMKSADMQRKIAMDNIKYMKSSYWPTVSLEALYAKRDEDPATDSLIRNEAYAGLRLDFPFFEGGLRRAEVREAEAKYRQANLMYEDLRKSIGIEVDGAYLDFLTQKGVLKSLEDQYVYATDNYNSISKQYIYGLANSIDVIDANTLLVTSERQLIDARYYYQLSILRLKRVTGTLLKSIANQLPSQLPTSMMKR
jgi:outer membrane protein